MTTIEIPDFSLVILAGPTGSGKSSFAARHFRETEVVSSDRCRALVSDDETDQEATSDAFELLRFQAGLRLKRRLLAVIDATSVNERDRAELVRLARRYHALPVALVFDIDPDLCHARNAARQNRAFGPHVARNHSRALRRGLKGMRKEGFRQVHVFRTPEEMDAARIVRTPLYTDRRGEAGPFDIVGDVHGCFEELVALLSRLGWEVDPWVPGEAPMSARHPAGRRALFLGDLTDRGPRNVDVLRLVMGMVEAGVADCVMGNHDYKLVRYLKGRKVTLNHGLEVTAAELEGASGAFRKQVRDFVYDLRSHLWLADGRLVVAHAGLKEEMHGRGSGAVRSFAMFGDTTGEVDSFGLPVRLDWAREYRGAAEVVYGHTPTPRAEWLNGTICIDTGCVFGGALTALRWPERELVDVPARHTYAEPARPLEAAPATAQQVHDRLLYFDDFAGRRRLATRYGSMVIPEEHALAALEVTSRFGIDPRWLIHLPPTMAACPTAPDGPLLERPEDALDHYAAAGVRDVVAEEKHMGSRALLVVARDAEAAARRFGTEDGKAGVVYTRTGRAFFADRADEAAVVARAAAALGSAGLWEELATDWVCLDAEIMPWSAKAQELLRRQFLPTAAAAGAAAGALVEALADSPVRGELAALADDAAVRRDNAAAMARMIEAYSWPVASVDDYRIAPFHLLAAEGRTFFDAPHPFHMETLARLCRHDPLFAATTWHRLDPADPAARAALSAWWHERTQAGGEGMVVKPAAFVVRGEKGLVQPAMKVRGRDYLRLVYGPDYDLPDNIARLRQRGLKRKFSLASREFRLGMEALHRFVERAPLAKVHECVLAVLALESEPVDPRL